MRRILVPCALIAAWVVALASASAQGVRTEGQCSPVVGHTQGNVTINVTGGCTAGITPAQLQQIIDASLGRPDNFVEFEELAPAVWCLRHGVGEILSDPGREESPNRGPGCQAARDCGAAPDAAQASRNPVWRGSASCEAIKKAAVAAIGAGDYPRAQALLEQAFEADLVAARKALDTANRRYVTAAKTKADLGQLKLSQLQYEAAAQEFQAAADLVPASEPLIRAQYLVAVGEAAYSAGTYPRAESALTEALRIREKLLATDHPMWPAVSENLAMLYRAQGRYAEAEPLYKRALAISEKALGPEHPDVGTRLNNLALLYLSKAATPRPSLCTNAPSPSARRRSAPSTRMSPAV